MNYLPLVALIMSAVQFASAAQPDPLDDCNVVWESPSTNAAGSMPLGNGDIGLNVWAEPDGDLLFYIGKTDSWSENVALLKLGRVRVKLSPNPFTKGLPFRQTLRLRRGEIEIVAGPADSQSRLVVWVDANAPVVHVDAECQRETGLQVAVELWRTQKREFTPADFSAAYGMEGAPHPVFVYPDTVLPAKDNRIVWFHRNTESIWQETLKLQGMEQWIDRSADPLLDRTFGGIVIGTGLVSAGDSMLRSAVASTKHSIRIAVLTSQAPTVENWVRQAEEILAEDAKRDGALAEHRAWWDSFWQRSWIRVSIPTTEAARYPRRLPAMTTPRIPLRIGADSGQGNRFVGDVAWVRLYNRALTADEVSAHATGQAPQAADDPGCIAEWVFDRLDNGVFRNRAGNGLDAKTVGKVQIVDDGAGGRCARLDGKGWIEAAYDPRLDFRQACTLEAQIRVKTPGGRIIDKSQAGTNNGYLIDGTYRMITFAGHLAGNGDLKPGQWNHVAGTYDAREAARLYSNGKVIAERKAGMGEADPLVITRGYALQRFIDACAGRGAMPIKFNGSIFTVQGPDADYRAWGGPYWFQNTRLAYWPMLAAGDFELMQPLFDTYLAALPLARERSRIYYGHEGAYFPETMYFWGSYANTNYGWKRAGKAVSQIDGGAIARHFNGNLELLALMLDYWSATENEAFVRTKFLPLADDILTWWDKHTKRDANGRLRIDFASALESYHGVINDTPDVAGLQWVLDGALALPDRLIGPDRRAAWAILRKQLPPIPLKDAGGRKVINFAGVVPGGYGNVENPELYAVFPYRIYGVGKPDLEVGRATFDNRVFQGNWGWQQDDVQAALLGLTDVARQYVAERFAARNDASRFPAFWGPNFDWIPDQDHGGVAMRALQAMCMQADGGKILLLPAWPKEWDVEFKLHAPMRTTVECTYRGGKIVSMKVSPEERRKDIVLVSVQ